MHLKHWSILTAAGPLSNALQPTKASGATLFADVGVHQLVRDMVPGMAHKGTGVGGCMHSCEEMDDMFVDLEWDAVGDRVRKGASDGLPFRWLLSAWRVVSPVVHVPVEPVWVLFRCCFR